MWPVVSMRPSGGVKPVESNPEMLMFGSQNQWDPSRRSLNPIDRAYRSRGWRHRRFAGSSSPRASVCATKRGVITRVVHHREIMHAAGRGLEVIGHRGADIFHLIARAAEVADGQAVLFIELGDPA